MEIDIGVPYEEALKENSFELIPENNYEAVVLDIEAVTAKSSGRPMLKWTFGIINDTEFNSRELTEYTVLPWHDGHEFVTTGLFRLVSITEALGTPWENGKIYTEDYMGKSCVIKVIHKPYAGNNSDYIDEDGKGLPMAEIKKFINN